MKKIYAFILTIALVITTVFAHSFTKPAAATSTSHPDDSFRKITFADFGIFDGTYGINGATFDACGSLLNGQSLDKTVLCGTVYLTGKNTFQLILGGENTNWNGVRFMVSNQDYMEMNWYEGSTGTLYQRFYADKAGVSFVDEEFHLMISTEIIDNDIKIGVWFNQVLYQEEYIILEGRGDDLKNQFAAYCPDGDSITLKSAPELLKQPDDSFLKVTFHQFGIKDGAYLPVNNDVTAKGAFKQKDKIDKVVICGDYFFNGDNGNEYQIIVGGSIASAVTIWSGLRLIPRANGTMQVLYPEARNYEDYTTLYAEKAGLTSFFGETFRMMISTELIDYHNDGLVDDIKLGIWLNGYLYNNDYFIMENCGEGFGNMFGVYGTSTEKSFVLTSLSELVKLPDESFRKVTFSDFDEKKVDTLDKVAFSGDLRFSEVGDYQIIYGGNDGGTDGLHLSLAASGDMKMSWTLGDKEQELATIELTEVGLSSFFQEAFNLIISTELVDYDGDGKANDIEVTIWFNEIRYQHNGQDCFIVSDWGEYLGNGLQICCNTEGTTVLRRDVQEYQANPYYFVDISVYRSNDGYTAPEAPEGYVFAGWFEDEEYTKPLTAYRRTGAAWAKFVEEDVLNVKAQIRLEDGAVPEDETSIRFITTVDSLDYQEVSFYISKEATDGIWESEQDMIAGDIHKEIVYETLNYIDSIGASNAYQPTVFSWMSEYFKVYVLSDIPSNDYDRKLRVTPYWITLDGTTVRGAMKEICVNDYNPPKSANRSNAVSLDFIGEDVMPIAGFFGPHPGTWPYDSMLTPDYNTDTYFKMLADAGVNLFVYCNVDYASRPDIVKKQLVLGEKYGIGMYVTDSGIYDATTADELKERISNYSEYKSFCGVHLIDEPQTTNSEAGNYLYNYDFVTDLAKEVGVNGYSNLLPVVNSWGTNDLLGIKEQNVKNTYMTYVDDYHKVMDLNVLSWDYYPFDTWRNGEMDLFFWNIDTIRTKAQGSGVPFWAFVQVGSQWNDGFNYFESSTPYYPTKSQFMWNANVNLAFGAQGIQYFPLIQPTHFAYGTDETHWDFERNGIIGMWGNKTQWYGYAQAINAHISEIDYILMNSLNEGIMVAGTDAVNDTADVSCILSSYKELTSVASGNTLIGCFDYEGRTALYVVNYKWYDQNDTSAQESDEIVLQFDSTHDIQMIRKASSSDMSTDENNQLTLTMDAGEGVLLVLE